VKALQRTECAWLFQILNLKLDIGKRAKKPVFPLVYWYSWLFPPISWGGGRSAWRLVLTQSRKVAEAQRKMYDGIATSGTNQHKWLISRLLMAKK
jgi:hypothetical protein